MQLRVTGRHVDVTEAMKEYARDKLGRVMRERPHINEMHVIMDVEKYRHRVEITARGKNLEIFCSDETGDMYASIDGALAKLERLLRRYREKSSRKQLKHPGPPAEGRVEEEAAEPVIAHRFAMKPMYLNEALLQMKLDGHIFLVFLNAQTDEVNLIYRTGKGELGHLAPKKLRSPGKDATFQLRVFSEESISAEGKPRLLRKEKRRIPWSTAEETLVDMVSSGRLFSFFLSRNVENACLVYRRADGDYALIEPVK